MKTTYTYMLKGSATLRKLVAKDLKCSSEYNAIVSFHGVGNSIKKIVA